MLLLVGVYLAHVEFRIPAGVIDRALTLGVLFLGLSLIFGLRRSRPQIGGRPSTLPGWWLNLHAGITASLLTLAIIHGVFSHAHGFLAHLMMSFES